MNIKIETNYGTIIAELNEEKAPQTVKNFLNYLDAGHYDGTIFHRVIPNFMIQGGGFASGLKQKPTNKPIQNEAANGLKNDKGTLAMARTSEIHSATSQFFINLVDNDFLNFRSETPAGFGYCVFGKVTEGIEIVEKIGAVKTTTKGYYGDVPCEEVTILKMTRM